jgi:predicted dehydrogenase
MIARKPGSQVRYAVVGLGDIAQGSVLPAFRNAAAKTSRLAALVSGDENKLNAMGREHSVHALYTYEQYDQMLASGEIDAVYIALPNHLHHQYAIRAAEHRVHVLCEKPLALTEDECVEMIEAAETAGVHLMTAYRLHFEPANVAAVEIAQSGRLGEVRWFNSDFASQVTDEDDIRLKPETGGGVLLDLGIYCINTARQLFGEEPIEVAAFTSPRLSRTGEPRSDVKGRFRNQHPEHQSAGVDETAGAVMLFPKGRMATFTCSFATHSHSHYELAGSDGLLCVDHAYEHTGGKQLALNVRGRTEERAFEAIDQFAPEISHFSECIRSGRPPKPGGAEGLADVHIIRSIYEAAESGEAMKLDEHTLAAARAT